ncbi:unnamed protein product [Mycena citricolor]|uniref:tRNA (adenine(58)-N(1))-methyltransferase non-catalytic subunit TRM6 n=1 Tax=Mycena citricolor TaxID=2018698 RepID=A0AAD2GXK3_9AGAR|nr:unnamed protein product [Mycena citricolor]
MNPPTPPLYETRTSVIKSGATLLLRLPNGEAKAIKVEQNATVSLGKVGAFPANELIGQPFGRTYDIIDKKLKVLPPRVMADIEDTDATNEYINDGQSVQPLTLAEIQTLKQSGTHASEIIRLQIEQHANYSLKTEYSKEKYKKRKEAKYGKVFTCIEPTLFNVCEYWFRKDPARVRDIRIDALSQILHMANIRPGGRYLAVDDASGLLVAGILERMGGQGRLITLCNNDSPPAYPAVVNMNFNEETVAPVLASINWALTEQEHVPVVAPVELPSEQIKSDRQRTRMDRRKAAQDLINSIREEFLIVASDYEPHSILERLVPHLAGSASIVVQSPYGQVLSDLHGKIRGAPGYLCPSVSEVWMRRYQVLPGRTHPTMNTSGTGGFIFHAIKVFDDGTANAVTAKKTSKPVTNKPTTVKSEADVLEMEEDETSAESKVKIEPQAHALDVSMADAEIHN